MIDEREVREMLLRRAHTVPATPADTPKAVRRARRRLVLNGAVATVAAAAIAVATFASVDAIRRAPIPADDRSEELGIFAPVAGRIVYVNEAEVGDLGYDLGLWAIDPNGPSDTTAGPSVADDVASTLVRLDLEEATPLGWSSDGTELLFMRTDGDFLFPQQYLYVLHADGSETRLNRDPMYFGGATISPDGTRVVFAAQGDDLGLWVVDAEGGRPVPIPLPGAEGIVTAPTFSPDGNRIAYVDSGELENHLWVMDADGSNAHEILADEATVPGGSLQWSPAGDRIAGVARSRDGVLEIYTFAPDGSDLTEVIAGGIDPHWSPDGSQIAYTIECELTDPSCGGLAIADADGSNVREFGFAASGPWHPGVSAIDEDTPEEPSVDLGIFAPIAGRIVYYSDSSLWAVDPDTPSSSTLVRLDPEGTADADRFASFTKPLGWSSDGTKLLFLREDPTDDRFPYDTRLYILHADGTETQVIPEPVEGAAISPDGSRVAFAADGLYVVDAEGGEPVRIAHEGNSPTFSPDGTQIAYLSLPRGMVVEIGREHVWVVNADGTDAHEILADEPALANGVFGLTWSPAGDRIAIDNALEGHVAIYTFASDGSGFTRVVTDGANPFWSPDGSQIAYEVLDGSLDGLRILDADGVRIVGVGRSGPWHPGTLENGAGG
jgi:Tol biopolymer transport system component